MSQDLKTIVIAGASVAGMSAMRELREGGFRGRLVIVDSDLHGPYRRPEVSKGLLSGALSLEKVGVPWPDGMDTEIVKATLTGLNVEARVVTAVGADRPIEFEFDGLVIATGAQSRKSPFGDEISGVHSLRSYADAEKMRGELVDATRVVVVGGGFIGLEVAAVASKLGKQVTVIEAMELPLVHIFGESFSSQLLQNHRNQSIDFRLATSVAGLESDDGGHIRRVNLTDGTSVEADLVLVAIGSVPTVGWLQDSGLDISSGVVCDSTCAVIGAENIVAAGDVATWWNPLYERPMRVEHWTNAIEQGAYAARRLLGTHDTAGFVSAPYFWSDQHGSRIQSIGSTFGHDAAVALNDDPENLYVAYFREDKVIAVVGMHAGASIFRFRPLILRGATLPEVNELMQQIDEARQRKLLLGKSA